MASLTQWTWVWVDSRSWWWTGSSGVLWLMGSQRVRHDGVTDWTEKGMAISIGQYAPVFLFGEPLLPDREAWEATVCRDAKSWTWLKRPCMRRLKTCFACGSSTPGRRRCSCLACGGPGGIQCAGTQTRCWSYGPTLIVFFWASCSWRPEGLFGQSFSIVSLSSLQALRGLPCLGSFSAVQWVRHIEAPARPALWLGSYSIDRCIRHLRGTLGGVLLCSSVHQVFDGPTSLLLICGWVVVYILFLWSSTPVHSQLVFCMHFCVWKCVPDVSMERNLLHIHLLLHHLVLTLELFVLDISEIRCPSRLHSHCHRSSLGLHYYSLCCCSVIQSCLFFSLTLLP